MGFGVFRVQICLLIATALPGQLWGATTCFPEAAAVLRGPGPGSASLGGFFTEQVTAQEVERQDHAGREFLDKITL